MTKGSPNDANALRVRLAADLHAKACEYRCDWDVCARDHLDEADRLIALGWTRLPDAAPLPRFDDFGVPMLPPPDPALVGTEYGPVKPAKGMRHGPQCGRLDEQRLARALRTERVRKYVAGAWVDESVGEPGYATTDEMAAAIAKAYREGSE